MPDFIGLAEEWNWGLQEMGYSHVDLNGRFHEGKSNIMKYFRQFKFKYYTLSIFGDSFIGTDTIRYAVKAGLRRAAFSGYIQPARNRKRLTIKKFSSVEKV